MGNMQCAVSLSHDTFWAKFVRKEKKYLNSTYFLFFVSVPFNQCVLSYVIHRKGSNHQEDVGK